MQYPQTQTPQILIPQKYYSPNHLIHFNFNFHPPCSSLSSSLSSPRPPVSLPAVLTDDAWEGHIYPSGTMVARPLGASDAAFVTIEPPADAMAVRTPGRNGLMWRFRGCFWYNLDHSGVDAAAQALRNWAGTGGRDLSSGNSNTYKALVNQGVMVYYCINAPTSIGNLDIKDANYALKNMDSACGFYTASYYKWDGSFEIVGKDRVGANICVSAGMCMGVCGLEVTFF